MRAEVALVCTDKGQHREWVLQSWRVDETTTVDRMMGVVGWSPEMHVEFPCGTGRQTIGAGRSTTEPSRTPCTRCPRLSYDWLWAVLSAKLAEAQAAGRRVAFDLSQAGV